MANNALKTRRSRLERGQSERSSLFGFQAERKQRSEGGSRCKRFPTPFRLSEIITDLSRRGWSGRAQKRVRSGGGGLKGYDNCSETDILEKAF